MAKTLKSEREVYQALCKRFPPPAYAVFPGVSNATGGQHTRTIDAIVASLWPSRGLTISAVEIKVSRGDLKREIADPEKAESFFRYVDHFWLAVGDASIVRDGDVPETWGLLVPGRGGALRVAKPAPKLKPEAMPRAFLAAILRRVHEHGTSVEVREEIKAELQAEVAEQLAELAELRRQVATLRDATGETDLVAEFLERCGIVLRRWNETEVRQAAEVVRALGEHGHQQLIDRVRYHAEHQVRLAAELGERGRALLEQVAGMAVDGEDRAL